MRPFVAFYRLFAARRPLWAAYPTCYLPLGPTRLASSMRNPG